MPRMYVTDYKKTAMDDALNSPPLVFCFALCCAAQELGKLWNQIYMFMDSWQFNFYWQSDQKLWILLAKEYLLTVEPYDIFIYNRDNKMRTRYRAQVDSEKCVFRHPRYEKLAMIVYVYRRCIEEEHESQKMRQVLCMLGRFLSWFIACCSTTGETKYWAEEAKQEHDPLQTAKWMDDLFPAGTVYSDFKGEVHVLYCISTCRPVDCAARDCQLENTLKLTHAV
jgi:hypothetical protein